MPACSHDKPNTARAAFRAPLNQKLFAHSLSRLPFIFIKRKGRGNDSRREGGKLPLELLVLLELRPRLAHEPRLDRLVHHVRFVRHARVFGAEDEGPLPALDQRLVLGHPNPAVFHVLPEHFEDQVGVVIVEQGGGLVHDDDLRVHDQGAANGDELAVPARDPRPAVPDKILLLEVLGNEVFGELEPRHHHARPRLQGLHV
mmetsp:Transcript_44173/g.99827  ORF Transcript_44173/g.99827 Transcript_44173/m.99827 type:complete len:201 (+) Transcript_44173:321-923(+)